MAGQLIPYKILRKVHFVTGGISFLFLLMYFITGFLLANIGWFEENQQPKSTGRSVSIRIDDQSIPLKAIARTIKHKLKIHGKISGLTKNEAGQISFELIKPGKEHQITYSPDKHVVDIQTTEGDWLQAMVIFHRLHGYGGGFTYDVYLFMMDISSIALIVFAITGILMWWQLKKSKGLGIIILMVSLAYFSWVMYQLMYL